MKKILITGANSYIGEAVKDYLLQEPQNYDVRTIDTIGWSPKPEDFIDIDVVFNVAGIAHIKETYDNHHLYYDINRDLVIKIAKTAKEAGVHQFILLSTMSVYGLTVGYIGKSTPVHPVTAYGESKAQADEDIKKLEDDRFGFCCLRPPMVYGKGCKGNYQSLRSFALKSPFFPNYPNQRSMIYIGNLCEFVKECIDNERTGLFLPQNAKYVNTSNMVKLISSCHGKRIVLLKMLNWVIRLFPINIIKKVFGTLIYEKVDLVDRYSFEESIQKTEEI